MLGFFILFSVCEESDLFSIIFGLIFTLCFQGSNWETRLSMSK